MGLVMAVLFEAQSGLAEEPGDERGLSLDAVQLVPYRGGELVCGPLVVTLLAKWREMT